MKPITKPPNKADIITLYIIALITALFGIYYNRPFFYVVTVVLILLALFRKYWLMKKLKKIKSDILNHP